MTRKLKISFYCYWLLVMLVCRQVQIEWCGPQRGPGIFLVNHLWCTLFSVQIPCTSFSPTSRHSLKTFPKIKAFAWTVTLNRILTLNRINTSELFQKNRAHKAFSCNVYVMCFNSGKTIGHLFQHCLVAWDVQQIFCNKWCKLGCPEQDVGEISNANVGFWLEEGKQDVVEMCFFFAMIGCVWSEFYARISDSHYLTKQLVWNRIVFLYHLFGVWLIWFSPCVSLSNIQRDWRTLICCDVLVLF